MSREKMWNFGIPKMGKSHGNFGNLAGVFWEFSWIFSDGPTGKSYIIRGSEKTPINSYFYLVFGPAGVSPPTAMGSANGKNSFDQKTPTVYWEMC